MTNENPITNESGIRKEKKWEVKWNQVPYGRVQENQNIVLSVYFRKLFCGLPT